MNAQKSLSLSTIFQDKLHSHSLLKILALLCFMTVLMSCHSANHQNGDVLSPQMVLANKDLLLNQTITVRGIARADKRVLCTLMACPVENPCCNMCGAALQLCESESCLTLAGTYAGTQVGCSGNECGLTCFPLEQGLTYQVTGVWKKLPYEQYVLEFRRIDAR
jgi:hypothetical protein